MSSVTLRMNALINENIEYYRQKCQTPVDLTDVSREIEYIGRLSDGYKYLTVLMKSTPEMLDFVYHEVNMLTFGNMLALLKFSFLLSIMKSARYELKKMITNEVKHFTSSSDINLTVLDDLLKALHQDRKLNYPGDQETFAVWVRHLIILRHHYCEDIHFSIPIIHENNSWINDMMVELQEEYGNCIDENILQSLNVFV